MSKEDRYSHLGTADETPDTDEAADVETSPEDEETPAAKSTAERLDLDGVSVAMDPDAPDEPIRVYIEDDDLTCEDVVTALEQLNDERIESQSDPLVLGMRMSSRLQTVALAAGAAGAGLGAVGATMVLRRIRR